MELDEIGAASDEGRRERCGGRLRREREAAGLSQEDVARRLVSDFGLEGSVAAVQKAVSRAERGVESAEELLCALEALYGMRDAYPSAPKDPVRRLAWFAARNAQLQPRPPASGIFGAGKVPAEG